MVDGHPMPDPIGPSTPPCIDEPDADLVRSDFLAEQPSVHTGRERHECCAKARAEGSLWLGHALFGASNLRGVSREEVVHRLCWSEPGNRRQHPESIGRQHNDVPRVTSHAFAGRIRNVADGIGGPRVLRERCVVEVEPPSCAIHAHVLQDGPKLSRGLVDLRLRLCGKMDNLRVAATLEIEHSAIAPSVLIVPNKGAAGISGQCGFPRAGQSEEDRNSAIGTDIGGAVHGENILLRKQVVHHAKDRFLNLARILCTPDQHELLGEVHDDEDLGVRAVDFGNGVEVRGVDKGELRHVSGHFSGLDLDEHVAREKVVPSGFGDDANRQTIPGVRTHKAILNEEVAILQICQEPSMQPVELLGLHGPIYVAPPHLICARWFANDEFVARRSSGVLPRADDQRP